MFEELLKLTLQALEFWRQCSKSLRESSISFNEKINSIDSNLDEFEKRIITIIEYIASLKIKTGSENYLINKTVLSQTNTNVLNIINNINTISQTLTQITANGGMQSIDYLNFTITDKKGTAYNLAGFLTSINSYLDNLLGNIASLIPFIEIKGISDLSARSRKLNEIISESEKYKTEISEILKNITNNSNKVKEIDENTSALLLSAQSTLELITEDQKKSATEIAEIQSRGIQARDLLSNSQVLTNQLVELDSKFKTFDKLYDERVKFIDEAKKKIEDIEKLNLDRENTIKELTEKAESLLIGATAVGLAKSFSDSNTHYKEEVKKARNAFYWSIAFLFLSSVPLLLYFLPISLPESFTFFVKVPNDGNITGNLIGLLSRIIIMIPTTWLTTFNSRRYSELFMIQQDYQYRETIAKSVDGFKKEAPKYEQEITAGVFVELNKNPADGLKKYNDDSTESPNFFNKLLLNIIEKLEIFTQKKS